jgi:malonyl-CoA/methylmalonyl-CoA synthetase
MLPRFDANATWDAFASSDITLFMAVPTIYAKLIYAWEMASPERRAHLSQSSAKVRLMVSGSQRCRLARSGAGRKSLDTHCWSATA